MSIRMMLDNIIINIFTHITKKSTTAHQEHLFSIFKDDVISGILHIENTKADLEKKVDEFINDKSDFNNTHIIK